MKTNTFSKLALALSALVLGGYAWGSDFDAQFSACLDREKEARRTASCADTLFNQFAAQPYHSLKPALLRLAASMQKILLSFDKGEIAGEEIKVSINMITAQFLQDVQDATRDKQTQAQVEQMIEQRRRQSVLEAARIFRESTAPIMVPQPADNSMNCRSYRNGNEIVTNCR
jgi:hypothetical protein